MNIVILENIRSAYNVWNIIRTADALGRKVRICGYTPNPFSVAKVKKTSLGAENNVDLRQFWFSSEAVEEAKKLGYSVIAAEIADGALSLSSYKKKQNWIAVIFGNEVEWVLKDTMKIVDDVVYIPMKWVKESLNVGQSTAIMMRELWKTI